MKKLPKSLTAIAIGGCSPAMHPSDAGFDASVVATDAGTDAGYDAGRDGGDAGCVLPSDFPWDAGLPDFVAHQACQCLYLPTLYHCYEENGPRCEKWECPPGVNPADGGYLYQPDGGVECFC